jgi:hypothetical protein
MLLQHDIATGVHFNNGNIIYAAGNGSGSTLNYLCENYKKKNNVIVIAIIKMA